MVTYQRVIELVDQLPLTDKARLIEHLSVALRQRLESVENERISWHEFIEQTAGSLADNPIERPSHLQIEDWGASNS